MAYVSTSTYHFPLSGLLTSLRLRIKRHLAYRETLAGLSDLTNRELADLGLTRGELRHVAWQAALQDVDV